MSSGVLISDYVARWRLSPFGAYDGEPWAVTQRADQLVGDALQRLTSDFAIANGIAVHSTATVEASVVLKPPIIVGPRCLVAAGAYMRGGVFLEEDCIVGPGSELKTSFMFKGSKIAHLNFVGDSILGAGVNIEAGAMVANYRNELDDKTIRIGVEKGVIHTGVDKFGSLIGDNVRIGANAVIAPGALLSPGLKVRRLELVDQYPGV